MMSKRIYKLCGKTEWEAAEAAGIYAGSADDKRDGFIHFSLGHQVVVTAAKYFAAEPELLLICFEDNSLGTGLKYEPSRGGDLFPHLYGTLDPKQCLFKKPVPKNEYGHDFSSFEL